DVDERGAAILGLPVQGIDDLAAVVADVGDPASTVLAHEGLVGRSTLQRIMAKKGHVRRARRMLRVSHLPRKQKSQQNQAHRRSSGAASYRKKYDSGTRIAGITLLV